MKKYYLSFVEEVVMNPQYKGFVGGRVEVYIDSEAYAIEEIRFFTKKQVEFYKFRDELDGKYVNEKELDEVRNTIKEVFYDEC